MEHYYTEKPLSKEEITKINIKLKKDTFELLSANGLFSKHELDAATALLIEKAQINRKKILDLGCGYGVVGIALLRDNPELDVTFSDINERAIKITKMNLDLHRLKGVVIKSNLFENLKEQYDHILSNPPYAAGRELCFKLIEESYYNLTENGTLQIVARHNKGGKALKEKIYEVFGNAEDVAIKSGFRIYKGTKK